MTAVVRILLPEPRMPESQKVADLVTLSQVLYSLLSQSHRLVVPYRFFRPLFRAAT